MKARTDFEPFGASITASTTGPLPREQFTGQQRDSEVGLDYFGARFYQAAHGRMLSVDPLYVGAVGEPQRWNRYAYALNSPQVFTDPDGRQAAACTTDNVHYYEVNDGIAFYTGSGQVTTCQPGGGPSGGEGDPTGGTRTGRPGQGTTTQSGNECQGNECGQTTPPCTGVDCNAPPPPPPPGKKEEDGLIATFCKSLPELPAGRNGISYEDGKRIGLSLLNSPVRESTFYALVQNRGPLDVKQHSVGGKDYEDGGNVLYGLVGTSAGLGLFVNGASAYAHVRDQWDANPFSAQNLRNEFWDQVNVTKGIFAAALCW